MLLLPLIKIASLANPRPPLLEPSGIFDFAIQVSKTSLTVKLQDLDLVKGSVDNSKLVAWLQLCEKGLDHMLLHPNNARFCVDLMDLCSDRLGVKSCFFAIPKKAQSCVLLSQFLCKVADAKLVDPKRVGTKNLDAFDWLVCKCEL